MFKDQMASDIEEAAIAHLRTQYPEIEVDGFLECGHGGRRMEAEVVGFKAGAHWAIARERGRILKGLNELRVILEEGEG